MVLHTNNTIDDFVVGLLKKRIKKDFASNLSTKELITELEKRYEPDELLNELEKRYNKNIQKQHETNNESAKIEKRNERPSISDVAKTDVSDYVVAATCVLSCMLGNPLPLIFSMNYKG